MINDLWKPTRAGGGKQKTAEQKQTDKQTKQKKNVHQWISSKSSCLFITQRKFVDGTNLREDGEDGEDEDDEKKKETLNISNN